MSEYVRAKTPKGAHELHEQEMAALALTRLPEEQIPEYLRQLQYRVETHEFQFAKTMKENPHWYTLRKTWDDAEFDSFVLDIRRYGEIRYFGRWPYVHLDLGSWTYWTMGYPVEQTTLVNRKRIVWPGP